MNFTQFLINSIVLALVLISTGLVAQINSSKEGVAPAGSGQDKFGNLSIEDFHNKIKKFITQEEIHDSKTYFSDRTIIDNCDKQKCKTFYVGFTGAANSVLIPDQVVFVNQSTKKIVGGLDSRDFVKGKTTQIQLPIGIYTMIAKHHMYDDIVWNDIPELHITDENVNEPSNLKTGMALKKEIEPILQLYFDTDGIHLMGQVNDEITGLPLKNVKVSISEFYPNYSGDKVIYTVSDEYGYFFSSKAIPFPIKGLNSEEIQGYSGSRNVANVKVKFEHPDYLESIENYSFDIDTRDFQMYVFGHLRKKSLDPGTVRSIVAKKLRVVSDQTKFFNEANTALLPCSIPTTIRVGLNCQSCSKSKNTSCTQYKQNGSPDLIFEKYVTAVLVKEWFSEVWGGYSGSMDALNAGAVAIRTNGAYYKSNPINSTQYDIGNSTCWQVFSTQPNYYSIIINNPNTYPKAASAVSATTGWVLREGSVFPISEFAAETNDVKSQYGCPSCKCNTNYNYSGNSCGDGRFRRSQYASSNCYPEPSKGIDYVSLGKSDCYNSHPRGMSQRGTFKWSTGLDMDGYGKILNTKILPAVHKNFNYCIKDWQQLLGHYYPYYTLENCNSQKVVNLASLNQACNQLPDLTDGGSSRLPNGRNITITASIKNAGNSNAGPASFTTRFVLSSDIYLGNDYHLVYLNYNNFTITPGNTYNYTFNWNIQSSIPSGYYYLIETLDYYNAVNESNENNSWYFAGQFYVPPYFKGVTTDYSANAWDIDAMNLVKVDINNTEFTFPTFSKAIQTTNCDFIINENQVLNTEISEYVDFTVFNLMGQSMISGKINGQNINLTFLPSGIYFLGLSDGHQNRCLQKVFIK